jgi:branched-chain amino acid transport system permease protein
VAGHLAVVALLFLLQFVVPEYHQLTLTRCMVFAVYAIGFNVLFGYTGLLSLGHAMFFAAGLYGAGMAAYYFAFPVPAAFVAGCACGLVLGVAVAFVALRTTGVAFMIVTLMFAQAFHLSTLYFGDWTRGDEGLVLPEAARSFGVWGLRVNLVDPAVRYDLAVLLLLVAVVAALALARGPRGRVLVAIRENEERTRMLGFDTLRAKREALVVSAVLSAAAGAAYALLFAYVGSTFASIQYSIYPLLWTLVGGAGTVLGPLLGTILMFYAVDVTSEFTAAYMLVVGVALIVLVMFFPKGVMGEIRRRWAPWLP